MKVIPEEEFKKDVEMMTPPLQNFQTMSSSEAVCEATVPVAAAPAFVDHTVSDEFVRRVDPRRLFRAPCCAP